MSKLLQVSLILSLLLMGTVGCESKGTVSQPTGQPSDAEKEKLMKQYTSGKAPEKTEAAPAGDQK